MLHYYYFSDNQSFGPYSKEQLLNLELDSDTQIWDVRIQEWNKLKDISELNQLHDIVNEKFQVSETDWFVYINIGKTSFDINKKLRNYKISFWFMSVSLLLLLGMMGLAIEKMQSFKMFMDLQYFLSFMGFIGLSFVLRFFFFISALICLISFLELIYYSWKIVEPNRENITASKAIGYLFIPFFNIYWAYFIFKSLPDELKLKAQKWGLKNITFVSNSLVIVTSIVFMLSLIPVLNIFLLIPFLILSYVYITQVVDFVQSLYRHIEINKMKK